MKARNVTTRFCVAVCLFVSSLVFCQASTDSMAKKGKIIQWGDAPPATYIEDHIREMEQLPFDGIIMGLQPNTGTTNFSWNVWGPTTLRAEDFSRSIDALKATKFKRFTDNFLILNVCAPGEVDWYGDEFSAVIANARLLARIAKECHMKGVVFDTESYGLFLLPGEPPPFAYSGQRQCNEHGFADYQRQARKRGREMMQAMTEEYPDITILLPLGYVYALAQEKEPGYSLERTSLGLLPSFLDGMLDASGPKTLIFDGFEYAYGYRMEKQFQDAREMILIRGLDWTGAKEKYRKHYLASFPVWLDFGRIWDKEDFTKNYLTPEEFEYALHLALKYTDRYVWVYCERARFWNHEGLCNVPQPYMDAIANARKSHGTPPTGMLHAQADDPLSAKTYGAANDGANFGDLWDRYEEVMSLPHRGWKFKLDPKDEGKKRKWFSADADDSQWKDIEIAEWWEPQGNLYDGAAWYRQWIDVPASTSNRKLRLVFGGVDESAWLYINGRYVGKHDEGVLGRWTRFEFDVSELVRPGQRNLIAVKVFDSLQFGGIWKPIKLVAVK